MAPRKVKSQGKRNNFKIKSKVSSQKRGMKPLKKLKGSEKPLENLKWLNKVPNEKVIKKCNAGPGWLDSGGFKRVMPRRSPEGNDSDYIDYPAEDGEEKSTISDMSDECNCSHSKYSENKGGILKRKSSSTSSLVAKYIKSGMDHVASFIVESAIRFGEKHGVVIPDKNIPNVYEITPPDKFDERFRKIRFQIPNKSLGYEETSAKKATWRGYDKDPENERVSAGLGDWKNNRAGGPGKSSPDSLEEILPLLEDLKDGEEITSSEVDENNSKDDTNHKRNLDRTEGRKLKERSLDRKADRSMERKMDRKMDRMLERSAERNIERKMDRNADRKFTRSLERSMDRKPERSLEMNADRDADRKAERSRDRNMERNMERDMERDKERDRGRNRERLREKLRSLGKRFKSLGAATNKEDDETEYALKDNSTWKKFRRDSLELGRQRLRASTCPRKPENGSPSPY